MLSSLPALLFWIVLHGGGKMALYGVSYIANLAVGIGLWRMREWARRLALALLAFGAVQTVVDLLRPSLVLQLSAEIRRSFQSPQPPAAVPPAGAFHVLSFSASLVVLLAVGCMLPIYRGRFAQPRPPFALPPGVPV
ncbi:MAG: hypothetical protein ACLGP3_01480 [Acidobacteriota bacterium]